MVPLLTLAYLLCVAVVLGQQQEDGCVWDAGLNLALDSESFNVGATYLAHLPEVQDDQCREECCKREDCQLALVGTPADGQSECFLVNCIKEGEDVCVLAPSTQFRAYRKSGQSPETRAEAQTNTTSTVFCRFQKAVGHCRAAFPRFYYDVTNQTCQPFTYGGCGGNENRFITQDKCEATCSGVTGAVIVDTLPQPSQKRRMAGPEKTKDTSPRDPLPEMTLDEFAEKCQAEPQVGRCRASIPRFYYKSGICQQFTYGGCGGNKNSYVSEEECMKTCTVKIVDLQKEDTDNKEYQEACNPPPDSGLCRAAFPMFFFEPSTQSCKLFTYGGCGGNKNRYDSEEECMSKCAGKDGSFGEHGHNSRARWTPAFFLMSTLAIMSMVLLVGLLVISSRRARQQLTFTLDDKQELLPEEYLPAEELPRPVTQ